MIYFYFTHIPVEMQVINKEETPRCPISLKDLLKDSRAFCLQPLPALYRINTINVTADCIEGNSIRKAFLKAFPLSP